MRFVRFSYYKTANCTAPCGVVRYDAVQYYLRRGYATLRAVFMWFSEHP